MADDNTQTEQQIRITIADIPDELVNAWVKIQKMEELISQGIEDIKHMTYPHHMSLWRAKAEELLRSL